MVLDDIKWYWSFSFSISPSSEYSGLISFTIDWFDLLAVTRDSQESSPTPLFKNIHFSMPSLLYGPILTFMTTGKTVALTIWTLFGKVMSLLFKTRHLNMAGMTSRVMI